MNGAADDGVINWLLEGDVAIQYQVQRDLLGQERPDLQARIEHEGWGATLLAARNPDGTWASGFYQPKWTSSHYTLLDLRNLGVEPDNDLLTESVNLIIDTEKRADGGIGPGRLTRASDVCVNGMFLDYASYFGQPEDNLRSVVDFLLGQQMGDGGFNCRSTRGSPCHSSMHSTIAVLEGATQYKSSGYRYRVDELDAAAGDCVEFLLVHRLFRSHRTGDIIKPEFLKLPYPWRWKYNILRALDGLRRYRAPWDDRMEGAVERLVGRQRRDGRWNTMAAQPGAVHMTMEKAGQAGRWNTLIAMRALSHYNRLPESGTFGSTGTPP